MGKAHPALHRTQCVSLGMFPLDRLCSMPDAGWLHQEDALPTSFFYPCSRNFLPAEAIGKGQGCGWVCSGAGSHGLFSMIVSDWLPEWWHLNIKVQMLNTVSPKWWTPLPHSVCVTHQDVQSSQFEESVRLSRTSQAQGAQQSALNRSKNQYKGWRCICDVGVNCDCEVPFFLEGKKLPDVEGL